MRASKEDRRVKKGVDAGAGVVVICLKSTASGRRKSIILGLEAKLVHHCLVLAQLYYSCSSSILV